MAEDNEVSLAELATHIRVMQMFAHIAHNEVSGPTFFEDHEFFGELYTTYETVYDELAERMIGLGEETDLWQLNADVNDRLQELKETSSIGYFSRLLELEKRVVELVEDLSEAEGVSQATGHLLEEIGDASEVRQYKLQQKLSNRALTERAEDALDRMAREKSESPEEPEEKNDYE